MLVIYICKSCSCVNEYIHMRYMYVCIYEYINKYVCVCGCVCIRALACIYISYMYNVQFRLFALGHKISKPLQNGNILTKNVIYCHERFLRY